MVVRNFIPSRIVEPKAPWSEVTLDRHHFNAVVSLSVRVRNVLGERRGDWVRLVADIYKGGKLPDAVAASIDKLDKLSSLKRR